MHNGGQNRMAASPQLIDGFLKLTAIFENTALEPVAREVLVMTVATRNRCHICVAMHTARLTALGADPGAPGHGLVGVDLAEQDHLRHLDGLRVGDPKSLDELHLHPHALHVVGDLGSASMDDHRVHADVLEKDDVPCEGLAQLLARSLGQLVVHRQVLAAVWGSGYDADVHLLARDELGDAPTPLAKQYLDDAELLDVLETMTPLGFSSFRGRRASAPAARARACGRARVSRAARNAAIAAVLRAWSAKWRA